MDRRLSLLMVLLMGLAVGSALSIRATMSQGGRYTEFYVLTSDDAANYPPQQAVVGEQLKLTLGVSNHEGEPARYWIIAFADGEPVAYPGPFDLAEGESITVDLVFVLTHAGDDQGIQILLYREGDELPYRRLEARVTVKDTA